MEEKVFFSPGDVVKVDKKIENVPLMYVIKKEMQFVRGRGFEEKNKDIKSNFIGIRCRWFDKNQAVHEAVFDTKDLMLIESTQNNY